MSLKTLNIYEIRSRFSYYAKQVMRGKSFLIAVRNRPFAELRPLPAKTPRKLVYGVLEGMFTVPEDFDAPLPEFESDFYGK